VCDMGVPEGLLLLSRAIDCVEDFDHIVALCLWGHVLIRAMLVALVWS